MYIHVRIYIGLSLSLFETKVFSVRRHFKYQPQNVIELDTRSETLPTSPTCDVETFPDI